MKLKEGRSCAQMHRGRVKTTRSVHSVPFILVQECSSYFSDAMIKYSDQKHLWGRKGLCQGADYGPLLKELRIRAQTGTKEDDYLLICP